MKISKFLIACYALVLSAVLVSHSAHAESSFYREDQGQFSLRPAADKRVVNLTRFGPVGLSLDLVQPAFTMVIKEVEPGSPAAKTGKLKAGQVIVSINGETLKDIDPRIQLGNMITKAEATDGKMVMLVAEKPGGETSEVTVQLEILGAYSMTWPINCPKSDKIVRNLAEYLKTPGNSAGFADLGMLFLLSTGDDSDLDAVRKWAHAHKGDATYPWHIGYGGLALCEYYLRTGDAEVLPTIQKLADKLVEMENLGGWAGRGPTAALGYGGGGGHLNAAGTLCVGYLMLAVECGAKVPDETLQRVLTRFYRYSARGNVPYGQGKPERGFTDNGKNGKLAFSMAAAASLDPMGEKSIYAKARDASAQFSFYSTSYMLHGHTGGGIGEIWRSASMGLVKDKLQNHYREFMDSRRWHYEMSRRFDGTFGILGGDRYDDPAWGMGYALTYTVPRKTLRLTGAPATKFAKTLALPTRPWGTAADDDFQSIESAVMADGTKPDISKETFSEHSGLHLLRTLADETDGDIIRRYMHHPDYVIRSAAAGTIHTFGVDFLKEFLTAKDARVRRAALEGIEKTPDQLLTREVFDMMVSMLKNDQESWFVKELALSLIGKAPNDWIVDQVDLILPYLDHEEWWFNHSALVALTPVVGDERCYRKVLPAVGKMVQSSHRYNVTSLIRWGDFPEGLAKASPEVQKLARETLRESYLQFDPYQHPSNQVEGIINPTLQQVKIEMLTRMPGGYDVIYELGKKMHPDQPLPFKELFLAADPEELSPELRKVVDEAVGGDLIPQYVATHRDSLITEAKSEGDIRVATMPGLISLYEKVGVDEYSWKQFGREAGEMKWSYFSFNPKEAFMQSDDRLGRYREVTFPSGMENWYEPGFDPQAKGWKQGLAPFGAADGKLERFDDIGMKLKEQGGCKLSFCGCHKPLNTLWENDVLMIRGEFEFPEFEEGYRYRLLHGGISHVGSGGGYRLYVNGKLFHEDTKGVDRRAGENPEGRIIPADWWKEFEGGKVTISAISFKKNHPRTKKFGGNISVFMQRQKLPPLKE